MAFERIELNLIPDGDMPVFHCSQFDAGRPVIIDLMVGDDAYTPSAGVTFELHCRKVDDNIVTLDTYEVDQNTVTFASTEQLCACVGDNLCEVSILLDNLVLGTLNFILHVEPDPLAGGLTSETSIYNLTEQVRDITEEVIGDDYYNKTQVDNLLDDKADKSTTYTKTEVDTALNLKADKSNTYTKTEVNSALALKANASDVYTKSQTDTLLNAKANTSDLATVATTGNYNDLTNKPTLATVATSGSYDDLTDKPSIPAAQVQSDYAQTDDTKVDFIKNKPDLSIYATQEDVILATGTEDQHPYQTRLTPSNVGNKCLEKVVGVSCCFNQALTARTFTRITTDYTIVGNSDGSATLTIINKCSTDYPNLFSASCNFIIGHKYYAYSGDDNIRVFFKSENKYSNIFNSENGSNTNNISIIFTNLAVGIYTIYFQLIDLTALFGSAIADYLYTLESGTAGAGVSLFRKIFSEDYYPYMANTLLSSKPTSKVVKDSNNQTIATYPFGGAELSGLFKKDAEGNIYADGDIYSSDGTITRRYESRAYQAGDESLPDAITDGTTTVVKKATPTTETSTAYNNPQVVGAYEEFTDTRTIKMPCGHDTIYSKKTDYRYWG